MVCCSSRRWNTSVMDAAMGRVCPEQGDLNHTIVIIVLAVIGLLALLRRA